MVELGLERGGDAGDHADRQTFGFEFGALLDVQFDPGVMVAGREFG